MPNHAKNAGNDFENDPNELHAPRAGGSLPELAENDGENEEDENRDDGDCDYPIRSHPVEECQLVMFGGTRGKEESGQGGYSTYAPCPSAS